MIPGYLSGDVDFDDAFDLWKKRLEEDRVNQFAQEHGIDFDLLNRSLTAFSFSEPEVIPYIDEITKKVDFDKATDKSAGNKLIHNMKLIKDLPNWMAKLKRLYDVL